MPFCNACGRENRDDARFCIACGSRLSEEETNRSQGERNLTLGSETSGGA